MNRPLAPAPATTPLPAPSGSAPIAPRPAGPKLGFGAGLRALFRGVAWVMGSPSVWPLAAVPVVIAFVLVGAATAGGLVLAERLVAPLVAAQGLAAVVAVVGRIFFSLVALLVALALGISLAQPLAAPALDALAKRRARELGVTAFADVGPLAAMGRSIRVVGLALLVGVPTIAALSLVTIFVPALAIVSVPAKFFVAGVLAAWDIFDTPFGLAGMGVRARLAFMRESFGACVAIGLAFAAVALVPGLGLFAIPMAVAGATEVWAAKAARV
ncbi:MAG: EI24 domain-containing protein [Polyangiaceae bacterium]